MQEKNPKKNNEKIKKELKNAKEKDSTKNKIIEKEQKEVKSKEKRHISYNIRLIATSIIFIISLIICFVLAQRAFIYVNPKVVKYNEKGAVDYRVYLKDNDYYEKDYLEKDMIYVANLIKNIKVDFKYDFNIEEESNIKFTYQLLGKLIIGDSNSSSNFLEKDYVLSDEHEVVMENEKNKTINDTINIDYDYYNKIANGYKSDYAVDTNSYLKVYLKINKVNNDNDDLNLDNSEDLSISIPLSQKAVEITINAQEKNSDNKTVSDSELVFNELAFAFEIIFCVIAIIALVKLIKLIALLTERKNAFDLYINKILREYDRLIAETTTGINLEKNNIIKVSTFEELLDVRDNLKLPIMYYPIAKHSKCQFYIKNENDVYLVTIKEADLEGKENEKK